MAQGKRRNMPDVQDIEYMVKRVTRFTTTPTRVGGFKTKGRWDVDNDFYDNMPLPVQIDLLAKYIMENIPGEPSRSEGAVDCAIRLLKTYRAELTASRAERGALRGMLIKEAYCGWIIDYPNGDRNWFKTCVEANAALDAALKVKGGGA